MPKCRGGCGRRLKDPASIARGYGRVCAERHGIPLGPPSKPARAAPPSPAARPVALIPGQVEIPLADHQPTLWSL